MSTPVRPLRRALVVDDSRAARVALKKLLQAYSLEVALAESGEEALEFLQHDLVDVIFMDHTMPGMDGLEAVRAIKANPRTATIPVMMYTTREGEVYVGQARALGAVGVMPKNVEPRELFAMLRQLGLVQERRAEEQAAAAAADELVAEQPASLGAVPAPVPMDGELQTDPDAIFHEREATIERAGMEIERLVARMLEDQHLTLRSDILRSQRSFAKQVAKEIVLEQARLEESMGELHPTPSEAPAMPGPAWKSLALAASFIGFMVCAFLALQFKGERDSGLAELASLQSSQTQQTSEVRRELDEARFSGEQALTHLRRTSMDALAWSLNRQGGVRFGAYAFGDELAADTDRLLTHLQAMGFAGVVRLTSHLGEFCLMESPAGEYELAPATTPLSECTSVIRWSCPAAWTNDCPYLFHACTGAAARVKCAWSWWRWMVPSLSRWWTIPSTVRPVRGTLRHSATTGWK